MPGREKSGAAEPIASDAGFLPHPASARARPTASHSRLRGMSAQGYRVQRYDGARSPTPMRLTQLRFAAVLIVALVLGASVSPVSMAAADVPARLSDAEFWSLTQDLSEPNGYFRSEN